MLRSKSRPTVLNKEIFTDDNSTIEPIAPIIGAPDEAIQRQRQIVSCLKDVSRELSRQTEFLSRQNEQKLGVLKGISLACFLILAVVFTYAIRHW
jgi:hypothetical protein